MGILRIASHANTIYVSMIHVSPMIRECRGPCRVGPPGLIPLLILRLAFDGPVHGYQIIERVREMTRGSYAPETGVIYTALRRLEKRGLLTSRWEEGLSSDKRVYEITEEGVRTLREGLEALVARRGIFEELFEFYQRMWGEESGGGD